MRLLPQGRLRKCLCCASLLALAMGGFCTYLMATRDDLKSGFDRLRPDLTLVEVETILGAPGNAVKEIDVRLARPSISDMGKLIPDFAEIKLPEGEWRRRSITTWNTWEGAEGLIIAGFDVDDRLISATLIQRNTWRYQVQSWLPWLK